MVSTSCSVWRSVEALVMARRSLLVETLGSKCALKSRTTKDY